LKDGSKFMDYCVPYEFVCFAPSRGKVSADNPDLVVDPVSNIGSLDKGEE
jgi:hypothetical protein